MEADSTACSEEKGAGITATREGQKSFLPCPFCHLLHNPEKTHCNSGRASKAPSKPEPHEGAYAIMKQSFIEEQAQHAETRRLLEEARAAALWWKGQCHISSTVAEMKPLEEKGAGITATREGQEEPLPCPFCQLLHDPEKSHCNDPHTGALIRRRGPMTDLEIANDWWKRNDANSVPDASESKKEDLEEKEA